MRELYLLRGLSDELYRQAIECPTIAGRQALEEYAENLDRRIRLLELSMFDGRTYEQFVRNAARRERLRNENGRHLRAI
jgi:hypothetical protein